MIELQRDTAMQRSGEQGRDACPTVRKGLLKSARRGAGKGTAGKHKGTPRRESSSTRAQKGSVNLAPLHLVPLFPSLSPSLLPLARFLLPPQSAFVLDARRPPRSIVRACGVQQQQQRPAGSRPEGAPEGKGRGRRGRTDTQRETGERGICVTCSVRGRVPFSLGSRPPCVRPPTSSPPPRAAPSAAKRHTAAFQPASQHCAFGAVGCECVRVCCRRCLPIRGRCRHVLLGGWFRVR